MRKITKVLLVLFALLMMIPSGLETVQAGTTRPDYKTSTPEPKNDVAFYLHLVNRRANPGEQADYPAYSGDWKNDTYYPNDGTIVFNQRQNLGKSSLKATGYDTKTNQVIWDPTEKGTVVEPSQYALELMTRFLIENAINEYGGFMADDETVITSWSQVSEYTIVYKWYIQKQRTEGQHIDGYVILTKNPEPGETPIEPEIPTEEFIPETSDNTDIVIAVLICTAVTGVCLYRCRKK